MISYLFGTYTHWGLLGALLVLVSGVPYMWALCRRKIEAPVYSSWAINVGLTALQLFSYKGVGAHLDTTLSLLVVNFMTGIVIFGLALRYGRWNWSLLDTIAVVGTCIGLMLWYVTSNPLTALMVSLGVDVVSTMPLIVKAWRKPKDEVLSTWGLATLGNASNMLALPGWSFGLASFPVVNTILNGAILLPLLLHRIAKRGAGISV